MIYPAESVYKTRLGWIYTKITVTYYLQHKTQPVFAGNLTIPFPPLNQILPPFLFPAPPNFQNCNLLPSRGVFILHPS